MCIKGRKSRKSAAYFYMKKVTNLDIFHYSFTLCIHKYTLWGSPHGHWKRIHWIQIKDYRKSHNTHLIDLKMFVFERKKYLQNDTKFSKVLKMCSYVTAPHIDMTGPFCDLRPKVCSYIWSVCNTSLMPMSSYGTLWGMMLFKKDLWKKMV